ncbi:hypothetical protein F183_A13750 [Bryobacterales bacterium F-183]|nr:hypothetical protein F183_A13750 [Bryobacterales bacterium F-183]
MALSFGQLRELEELRAEASKDPAAAAEIAVRLDQSVQQRHIQAMKSSASAYPADLLRWLPPTVDQFWISTEPFALDPDVALSGLGQRPLVAYAADHLLSIDQGRFARQFYGRKLQLVAGAVHGARDRAYFHYFDTTIEVSQGEFEGTWVAVPKPNLLVTANSEAFLQDILNRMEHRGETPAPAVRPELQYADRQASLWGFGKGVALSFGETSKAIDLYFLQPPSPRQRRYELRAFTQQTAKPLPEGVTHMWSDIARGPGALQMAVQLVGLPLHPMAHQFLKPSLPSNPGGNPAPLDNLLRELEPAIRAQNWRLASQLTPKLATAVSAAAAKANGKETAQWNERILAWLPGDVETAMASSVAFTLAESASAGLTMKILPLLNLASAEKGELIKALLGRTVIAAFTALRPPQRPQKDSVRPSLGLQPFRGCGIYVFAQPLLSEGLFHRVAEDSVVGLPVWTAELKAEAGSIQSSYVSLPAPNILAACNDRDFLHDLLLRATTGTTPERVALPDSLSLWRHVDKTASVWGVSKYDSMAQALIADGMVKATGATVQMQTSSARIRMFATANPWTKITAAQPFKDAAKVSEIAPGVWELSIDGDASALQIMPLVALAALQVPIFI